MCFGVDINTEIMIDYASVEKVDMNTWIDDLRKYEREGIIDLWIEFNEV